MERSPNRRRPTHAADKLTGKAIDHGIYQQLEGTRAFHTLEPYPWCQKTHTKPFDLGEIRAWLHAEHVQPYLLERADGKPLKAGTQRAVLWSEEEQRHVTYTVSANAPEAFWDARAAIGVARSIEQSRDGQRAGAARDRCMVDAAIQLGKLLERIKVRPAEPFVKMGRKAKKERPEAMAAARKKNAAKKRVALRKEAEEALQQHGTRKKAAAILGIDQSTLGRRLKMEK